MGLFGLFSEPEESTGELTQRELKALREENQGKSAFSKKDAARRVSQRAVDAKAKAIEKKSGWLW